MNFFQKVEKVCLKLIFQECIINTKKVHKMLRRCEKVSQILRNHEKVL
jgi:hypothetical protein